MIHSQIVRAPWVQVEVHQPPYHWQGKTNTKPCHTSRSTFLAKTTLYEVMVKMDMVTKTCPGGPQCLWQDFYHPVSPENQKALSTCLDQFLSFWRWTKSWGKKDLFFDSLTFLFVISPKNGELQARCCNATWMFAPGPPHPQRLAPPAWRRTGSKFFGLHRHHDSSWCIILLDASIFLRPSAHLQHHVIHVMSSKSKLIASHRFNLNTVLCE